MKSSLAILVTVAAVPAFGEVPYDIPYFDEKRTAVIFLRAGASAPLIYLLNGRPVAYLVGEGGEDIPKPWRASFVRSPMFGRFDLVYSLGGKHLGWLSTGLMFDTAGRMTCRAKPDEFVKDPSTHRIPSQEVSREPRETPQPMPRVTREWSALSCQDWILGRGRDL